MAGRRGAGRRRHRRRTGNPFRVGRRVSRLPRRRLKPLGHLGRAARFLRDYEDLSAEERDAFMAAVRDFVEDLPSRQFRSSLRVKGVHASPGVFEMSWADDGRATWQYGPEVMKGQPHIIWRRIGGHAIFANP